MVYNLIAVARKAKVMPALQSAIQSGSLTVSKARKITSVLAPDNQEEWVLKAQTLSSRRLEEEVAKVNPRAAVKESVKFVGEDRLELRVGISKSLEEKLKRVQDLESQRTAQAATLEQALEAAVGIYLEKNDPVIKAQRILNKSVKVVTGRVGPEKPIPAHLKHQVQQRDGGHALSNLATLCSAHHSMAH